MRYTVTKAFHPRGSGSPVAAVGSDIELTESQARVFKAVGFVKDAEPQAEPQTPFVPPKRGEWVAVPTYASRAASADDENTEPAKKTTRRYQRRDLTAKTED